MSSATSILQTKPTNLAIATNAAHDLLTLEPPVPTPKPTECLVHVRATGICGSDVHFWKHGNIGESVVTTELGLGHESAGEVVKVGDEVRDLRIGGLSDFHSFSPLCFSRVVAAELLLTCRDTGDRVALENGIPCSQPSCTPCRTGQYHACPRMTFFSSPPVDGTLRRYHAHPAAWLHKLPSSLTFEEGALLEPLSVALAGIERAGLRLGDPLVICGAGPIGLVTLLAAHAAGAAPVVITDLDEFRLGRAKELVPRVRTVLVGKGEGAEETADRVKDALGGEAKLVMECSGMESSIHTAIYVSCAWLFRRVVEAE